jgi:hypothetical protein
MPDFFASGRMATLVSTHWRTIWFAVAVLTAMPTAYHANQALLQTRLELHTRLIVDNSLWESDPFYAGSPRDWTRFAAWLLDTGQLLERLHALHAAEAESIEQEYRRDVLLAFGGVIARFLCWWGVPVALAYAAGRIWQRRQTRRSV